MNPQRVPNATRTLGAPTGWNEDEHGRCEPLDIIDTPIDGGGNLQFSYWRPTDEELAALSGGALVRLSVWGREHPPVFIDVPAAAA